MKKTKLFFKIFFLCLIVGILVEVIWALVTGNYDFTFMGLDIIEELLADVILSCITVYVLTNKKVDKPKNL